MKHIAINGNFTLSWDIPILDKIQQPLEYAFIEIDEIQTYRITELRAKKSQSVKPWHKKKKQKQEFKIAQIADILLNIVVLRMTWQNTSCYVGIVYVTGILNKLKWIMMT